MRNLRLKTQELKALEEAIKRAQQDLDMYFAYQEPDADFADDPERVEFLRSLPEQWSNLANKVDQALYT